MIAELGFALILAGLLCAVAGTLVGFSAGRSRSQQGWIWTRRLALAFSAMMLLANGVMVYALLSHDFSVKYVAQVGSLASPAIISFVSLWSSLEGSILFWGAVLAIYVGGAVLLNGDRDTDSMPYAVATWLGVGAFFCFLMAGPANPFWPEPSPIPTDGPGPNALLQNHYLMIIHPPMLYLGYVGMTIPFGLAVASLMRGTLGAGQQTMLRNALMVPWAFLTVGITLGGWWAYEVLGWGGYWAWDPVENASLLPWLTATAALHAAMLPGRRGTMKGWTTTLVLTTFLLTLLGTFMTRSGVFNSVHSFSQSDIGPTFLVFIAICLVFSVILLATRVDRIEGEGRLGAPVSREAAFLVNNLLFVAMTFTVLLGTVYPLLAEAIKGVKVSVGEPYFNRLAVPIGVAILFLMGVGPALPWGDPDAGRVRRALVPPFTLALVVTGFGLAFGLREPWPLVTLACAGFASWVTGKELLLPLTTGTWLRQHRRMGGYTVHAGIIVMVVAIAMSSAYRTDQEFTLAKGEVAAFAGYTLTYTGQETIKEPHRSLSVVNIEGASGDTRFTLRPALVKYPTMMAPIGSPDVRNTLTHDLYLSLMQVDPVTGAAGIHAFHTPLVVWLWIGMGIVAVGSALGLIPQRRAAFAPVPSVAEAAAVGK